MNSDVSVGIKKKLRYLYSANTLRKNKVDWHWLFVDYVDLKVFISLGRRVCTIF